MPAVDNVLVPKPLTYTLMYHGLWAIIFLLTAMVYRSEEHTSELQSH